MSYNYTLKYRTFDQLLADVQSDFKKYQLQDLIDPQDMIKVTKRVNYDLGLRINKTKEIVLEVEKGRVRLPNDFYVLNFALSCNTYTVQQYLPQGTHVEERVIGTSAAEYQPDPFCNSPDFCESPVTPVEPVEPCTDPCAQCGEPTHNCEPCQTCCANPNSCTLNCKGEVIQLVQSLTSETRTWTDLKRIRIKQNAVEVHCDCPNLHWNAPDTAWIKDGWIYTSFQTGNLYINYQGALDDDEGNLLVPDHDGINEYYEYALKQRIIENLIMDDEQVNPNKIQLIEQRYRVARNAALSIVNTPNFNELKRIYQMNRRAMYSKYYDMFASYLS